MAPASLPNASRPEQKKTTSTSYSPVVITGQAGEQRQRHQQTDKHTQLRLLWAGSSPPPHGRKAAPPPSPSPAANSSPSARPHNRAVPPPATTRPSITSCASFLDLSVPDRKSNSCPSCRRKRKSSVCVQSAPIPALPPSPLLARAPLSALLSPVNIRFPPAPACPSCGRAQSPNYPANGSAARNVTHATTGALALMSSFKWPDRC